MSSKTDMCIGNARHNSIKEISADNCAVQRSIMDTPIGKLCIEVEGGFLTGVCMAFEESDREEYRQVIISNNRSTKGNMLVNHSDECLEKVSMDLLTETRKQLEEYFDGKRKEFNLPILLRGTEFQKKVWQGLCTIPYGETRSYKELAELVGNPKAVRAVGGANNKNPIMIIVPCHRVIGADGSLVGFGGGLEVKKYLLELEAGLV